MDWVQCLTKAVQFIEERLTGEISIDEISSQSYSSTSHFQLIFHLVMGMTVGEYIRNRRLSLAAQDLLRPNSRIIDVAMRYQYDTQESFSKAFTRFHGRLLPPLFSGNAEGSNPRQTRTCPIKAYGSSRSLQRISHIEPAISCPLAFTSFLICLLCRCLWCNKRCFRSHCD